MIIDFHTHTFPDKIAAHAISSMQQTSHRLVFSDGTEQGLQQANAEAHVDLSVVLPVVTNPAKTSSINNASIAHTAQDGLLYFGGMHPNTEYWHQELGRLAEAGIKGIKLHPQYQGAKIDDIRYLRIMGRAAELGLIVVIHAGDEPAFPGLTYSNPEMIRNAMKQLNGITLVAAHMGGMWNWDRVTDCLADTGVYIDTSSAHGRMQQTDECFYHEDQLKLLSDEEFCKIVHDFGAHRVLFASDSPWTCQKASIQAIQALPLTTEEKEQIFFKNACHLLHI